MIELNRIYNMDCLEGMKDISDKSIDCVICDLPYGTTMCEWDSVIPFDKLWEQYSRICKETAPVILFGQEPFSSHLRISNLADYKYDIYWEKEAPSNFMQLNRRFGKTIECISIFYKKQCTYNPQKYEHSGKKVVVKLGEKSLNFKSTVAANSDGSYSLTAYQDDGSRFPKDVLRFNRVDKHHYIHPTQKPEDLIRYLVRTFTNPGDTILDNCMGSGTTAVAAVLERRKFIGFETNKDYFEKANERLRKLTGPFRIYGNIGV